MPDTKKCPQCGVALPAGVLDGLCPACLLEQGATADSGTQPQPTPFEPLPVAEVARQFPQLEILGLIGKGGMGAVYKARQVDARLDEVVLHALEKEPEHRYQQAGEVKTAVETIAMTVPGPPKTEFVPAIIRTTLGIAILIFGVVWSVMFPKTREVFRSDFVASVGIGLGLLSLGFGILRLRKGNALRIGLSVGLVWLVLFSTFLLSELAVSFKFIDRMAEDRPAAAGPGNGQPVSAEDPGQTVDTMPPVVVRTSPASGAHDVAPGIVELRVTFSKVMTDGSWSWSSAWADSVPEAVAEPRLDQDCRTCVLEVKLEPAKTYAYWLNSKKFQNFKDQQGRPAVPYLLIFRTRDRGASP